MCAAALTSSVSVAATLPGNVDTARLQAADTEPQNWFTGGRDKDGTYFSPLKTINADNAKQLGFAWSYDLGQPQRGQEATPLVIDGVMYTSGTWGYVYAVEAATGKELWRYDPKADFFMGRNPCCDLVNRGVAVWKGKVFVASVDGRLHALDAASGKKLWEADTIIDRKLPYSSTGAPQIAGNVVVIGNSGADMGHGAVRGYISAYDLETGALKWRFFTVPPAVGQPYENPELAAADKTWDPHRDPKFKGGATASNKFFDDHRLVLQLFILFEEMTQLLKKMFGQFFNVIVVIDARVLGRYGNDLIIRITAVHHLHDPHYLCLHQAERHHRQGRDHQDVQRVLIITIGLGYKTIIHRVVKR